MHEVPGDVDDALVERRELLEQRRGHVKVARLATGAAIPGLAISHLAGLVVLDLDPLVTVAASVLVVKRLGDGDDGVAVLVPFPTVA